VPNAPFSQQNTVQQIPVSTYRICAPADDIIAVIKLYVLFTAATGNIERIYVGGLYGGNDKISKKFR